MTDKDILKTAKQKGGGYVTIIGEKTIVTWWDRQSRNWISQIKIDDNQQGDAQLAGNRVGAESNHLTLVKESL